MTQRSQANISIFSLFNFPDDSFRMNESLTKLALNESLSYYEDIFIIAALCIFLQYF